MSNRSSLSVACTVLVTLLSASHAAAQTPFGSAFTYQGQLQEAGGPVNDTADFEFTLWADEVDGVPIGSTIAVSEVEVVNGVFAVTLDFGVLAFDGEARWLEIAVRPSAAVDFTTLSPRQALTATPYALQTRGIVVDEAGNVGIGVADPQEKLDVAGSIRMRGSQGIFQLNDNYLKFVGNNDTQLSGDGFLRLQIDSQDKAVVTSQAFTIHNDLIAEQRVGVGTTDPAAELDVVGDASVTGDITVDGSMIVGGELFKSYTPTSLDRAAPIAYGRVSASGSASALGSTDNFSATYNSSSNPPRYEILIDNENYIWTQYVTVATSLDRNTILSTSSASPRLIVYAQDRNTGSNVRADFHFISYKPGGPNKTARSPRPQLKPLDPSIPTDQELVENTASMQSR